MVDKSKYVFPDKLISPLTGYQCKKINKQNVGMFGFETVEHMQRELPGFPLICSNLDTFYREQRRLASAKSSAMQSKRALEKRIDRACMTCGGKMLSRNQTKFCSRVCSAITNNALNLNRAKQATILKQRANDQYNLKPKQCVRCSSNLLYENRRRTLCGSCRDKASARHSQKVDRYRKYGPYVRECKSCHTRMLTGKLYCGGCKTNIRHYRSLAAFKFNVYDYPDKFDLSLIDDYGWFSPNGRNGRNKNANLDGVSRDHLYSVADGFKFNRDPAILAHPANCQLLRHNGPGGNNGRKSSIISWDDLLYKIEEWGEGRESNPRISDHNRALYH